MKPNDTDIILSPRKIEMMFYKYITCTTEKLVCKEIMMVIPWLLENFLQWVYKKLRRQVVLIF